jgi:pSer/pThr/pTyr-binding forkhead associated (FHA) protein
MFALQIVFKDGVSKPETVFVRRPYAVIGAAPTAHIVLDDLAPLNFQLCVSRELGRQFRVSPTALDGKTQVPSYLEGIYRDTVTLDLGPVSIRVCPLDLDLLLKETEPLDRAGVRVLRQAGGAASPTYPALVSKEEIPAILSFVPDIPLYIGKTRTCAVRLQHNDIEQRHARMGFESGSFWVEDLGSTNGTFVNNQQISGRVRVAPGTPVVLGRAVTLIGVTSDQQLQAALSNRPVSAAASVEAKTEKYPVILSLSEVARPARIVVQPGASVSIGREPSSDMWLGAPHVSRRHCSIGRSMAGDVTISDHSTNGTAYDTGILRRGDSFSLSGRPTVLDFGGGITVAVCFNEAEEQQFVSFGGSPTTFVPKASNTGEEEKRRTKNSPRARTATLFRSVPRLNREESSRASFSNLKLMYGRMNHRGRMVVIAGIVGSLALIAVVINLLVGVVNR